MLPFDPTGGNGEAHTMSNIFKTGLLLAVLTAMLVVIGGAIGGQQGMFVAFFLALAMNFFSYWFSDKMVLATKDSDSRTSESALPGVDSMEERQYTRCETVSGRCGPGAAGWRGADECHP